MRPSPTMPSVLSASSTPSQRARSQRPATSAACAWGMLRAWASSSARVCSAAEMMFDCGALTTITPRRVASSTSTLSSPIPARAITLRFGAAASTAAVTCVALRITSASYGPMSAARSPLARSVRTSAWKSLRNSSSPCSDRVSVTRTRIVSACSLEHLLGRSHRCAKLHGVPKPLERHLDGGQPSDDVELAEVPEVPDAEDRALERPLPRGEHTAEVGSDRVADLVGRDAVGRADRGHRPVTAEPLAEQIEPDRPDPVFDRPAERLVAVQRRVTPSWKYSSSAARRPCSTLIAGVHG